jgi:hypothetical protein
MGHDVIEKVNGLATQLKQIYRIRLMLNAVGKLVLLFGNRVVTPNGLNVCSIDYWITALIRRSFINLADYAVIISK